MYLVSKNRTITVPNKIPRKSFGNMSSSVVSNSSSNCSIDVAPFSGRPRATTKQVGLFSDIDKQSKSKTIRRTKITPLAATH